MQRQRPARAEEKSGNSTSVYEFRGEFTAIASFLGGPAPRQSPTQVKKGSVLEGGAARSLHRSALKQLELLMKTTLSVRSCKMLSMGGEGFLHQ